LMVIEWLPTAKVPVLKDAKPPASVGAASCVWPSRMVTVPVGVTMPDCGTTKMVKFKVWPVVSCALGGVTEMVVATFGSAVTATDTGDEVDSPKLESPE